MSSERDMTLQARRDLAQRLGLREDDVAVQSIEAADFPDAALGAPVEDEMSAQVVTPGWRIRLAVGGKTYEYRANDRQLRSFNFNGQNYKI